MHAVVVKVKINDAAGAEKALREEVVPRVSGAPGFVAGYWVRVSETEGTSVIVFESEEAARGVAEKVESPAGEPATVQSVAVGEVVANA